MTNTEVHVRASELAATVAVDISKIVEGTEVTDPFTTRTFWSTDSHGFANHVQVKDVMWSATTTGGPTIIFVLENGQEFEAEVKPSSKALREARLAVEAATLAAQRAQDNAKNGS